MITAALTNRKMCSFCFTPETSASPLMEGQEAYICKVCAEEVTTHLTVKPTTKQEGLKKPHEIKALLDEYVIGQERAKRTLAVAAYNHYKRTGGEEVPLRKSNILLLGPSGSGKTHLVQTLARMLDVPFVIGDATSLTRAGYVGEDVESLLERLMEAADHDVDRAERGIIYIDEIDKLSEAEGEKKNEAGGRAVQANLLKMIEGHDVSVQSVKNGKKTTQLLSTRNILFIAGGAFESLWKKEEQEKTMGFLEVAKEEAVSTPEVTPEKLVKFGLMPELIGRIPVMAVLDELTESELVSILNEPKDSLLKEYQYLFSLDGVRLTFETEAVHYVAKEAISRGVGARGLRGIIEEQMMNLMYEVPEHIGSEKAKDALQITKNLLTGKESWKKQWEIGEETE